MKRIETRKFLDLWDQMKGLEWETDSGLCELLGISTGTVSRWRTGLTKEVQPQLIRVMQSKLNYKIRLTESGEWQITKVGEVPQSTETLYRLLRTLKGAFHMAIRWELISSNPCDGVQMPKLKQKRPLFFSRGEFGKLIAVITDPVLKDIVVFAANTGLRLSELLNLQWEDFNRAEEGIVIDPTREHCKGQKFRVVPLNAVALEVLQRQPEKSEYIFTRTGNLIYYHRLSKRFKEFVILAGVNPLLHFHSLRHTFASWLVQDGVSIYAVKELLGHSSVATTQIYSHLQTPQLRDAVARLCK